MARTMYFSGFHPSHFTDWGGTGTPPAKQWTYPPANGFYPFGDVNMGYISLQSSAKGTGGWGADGAWAPFKNASGQITPLTSFDTMFTLFICNCVNMTAATAAQFAFAIIHTSADPMAGIVMRNVPGSTSPLDLYLCTKLSDSSTYTALGMNVVLKRQSWWRFVISVQGAGTKTGSITLYCLNDTGNGLNPGPMTRYGYWTGDLTNYASFNGISFHFASNNGSGYQEAIAGAVVADYSLVNHYLAVQYLTTLGSDQEWSGNTTGFTAWPIATSSTNGLYGASTGKRVTFSPRTDSVKVGYEPRAVTTMAFTQADSAANGITVTPLVKASSTGTEYALPNTAYSVPQAQQNVVVHYTTNPITGNNWTAADVSAFEFGVTRTN